MSYPQFEDLKCWYKSRELVGALFDLAKKADPHDAVVYKLITDDAVQIMNNIAKGYDNKDNNSFAMYLRTARGYASEIKSFLYVMEDLKIISFDDREALYQSAEDIRKMLNGLIKHLTAKVD